MTLIATANPAVRVEQVKKCTKTFPAQYTVTRKADGKILGLLEKYRDSRTEKHPWKAFFGIGWECRFLDSYYPEEGGYDAAVNAVVSAS